MIGRGHIEPGLHDGGGDHYVELAVIKGTHRIVERLRRHLAVGDNEAHLGHVIPEELGDIGLIGNARADIKSLSTPIFFAQQRLAHHQRVEGRNEGANGKAVDRRGRQQRKITHPGQGQLQRARNGGRRKRQHVDVMLDFLEALLVRHAEMLLLVDDKQTQIAEADRFGKQCVGADDDIDAAILEALLDGLEFGGRNEARRLPHADGQTREALGKRLEVLAGEKRGRHDDRDLPPAHGDDEGGAQGDLGLAEADVPAHQPIHDAARGQVIEHGIDGGKLILGFLIGEARAKFVVGTGLDLDGGGRGHLAPPRCG